MLIKLKICAGLSVCLTRIKFVVVVAVGFNFCFAPLEQVSGLVAYRP